MSYDSCAFGLGLRRPNRVIGEAAVGSRSQQIAAAVGRTALAYLAAIAVVSVPRAHAAPVFGETFSVNQPDGQPVAVRVWGDEFYRVVESLDGYTVVPDPKTGMICYATLSPDGADLVSTGVRVGAPERDKLGLDRHIRIRSDAASAKIATARARLGSPQRTTQARNGSPVVQAVAIPQGAITGILLLVDFADEPATIARGDIDDFCNQVNFNRFGNNGSVRDYYLDVSDGRLTYRHWVSPAYYRAQNNKAFYDDSNTATFPDRARGLVMEALNDLDNQGFNFADFDTDEDGTVDAVTCLYAGTVTSPWMAGLWPHRAGITFNADGVSVTSYALCDIRNGPTLRTFCHESGHLLCDWPDLYDYGHESQGVGNFCLMAGGGSNTNPVEPCAYLKYKAGWCNTRVLTFSQTNLTVPAGTNTIFKYNHPSKFNEYYLIENRQQAARDAALPDSGLAIWHIDTRGSNDNEQMTADTHYLVTLVQADNRWDLETNQNAGDTTDLWSAPNHTACTPTSAPNTNWWAGDTSCLSVNSISASGTNMTFSFTKAGDCSTVTLPPFRATHNSYWLDHSPRDLIDRFNVWEIEIDFGIKGGEWKVGHDDVQSNHGLTTLAEWIHNISLADAANYHPVFIKLEAKNPHEHCDWPFCGTPGPGWGWNEWYDWPSDWPAQVAAIVKNALGRGGADGGLFTPAELSAWRSQDPGQRNGQWPPFEEVLANGPFVVCLINNDPSSGSHPDFFDPYYGGLGPNSERPGNEQDMFHDLIGAGMKRITLDGEYQAHWSNIGVHPPVPMHVNPALWPDPANYHYSWGVPDNPFYMVGHAANASVIMPTLYDRDGNYAIPAPEEAEGRLASARLALQPATHSERVAFRTPIVLTAAAGTASVGGPGPVAYTIWIQLSDVHEGGTDTGVTIEVVGDRGSTTFPAWSDPLDDPSNNFERGTIDVFWYHDTDVGTIQEIRLGAQGDDDIRVDCVYVDSATTGRYFFNVDTWIGEDNPPNPRTLHPTYHWGPPSPLPDGYDIWNLESLDVGPNVRLSARLYNRGRIFMQDAYLALGGGGGAAGMLNLGWVSGSGTIEGYTTNEPGAAIQAEGTLTFTEPLTNSGTIDVPSGSSLVCVGGGRSRLADISNAGTIRIVGGVFTLTGPGSLAGVYEVESGGTLVLEQDVTLANPLDLSFPSGTIRVVGSLRSAADFTNDNILVLDGGLIEVAGGNGNLVNGAGKTIRGHGTVDATLQGTGGTLIAEGGAFVFLDGVVPTANVGQVRV